MAGLDPAIQHFGTSMTNGDQASDDDYRLVFAQFLKGCKFRLRPYIQWSESWDHDHCNGCMAKFAMIDGPGILHEGYAIEGDSRWRDAYHWVCKECFEALKDKLNWAVVD